MKFKISPTIDNQASKKSHVIYALSSRLEMFFKDKYYGLDVQDYILSISCRLPIEGFEKFFAPKKSAYADDIIKKNRFTGQPIRLYKLFINNTLLSIEEYHEFTESDDEVCKIVILKKIAESLANLSQLPKKVKDFNKELFQADLLEFLKAEGLIV